MRLRLLSLEARSQVCRRPWTQPRKTGAMNSIEPHWPVREYDVGTRQTGDPRHLSPRRLPREVAHFLPATMPSHLGRLVELRARYVFHWRRSIHVVIGFSAKSLATMLAFRLRCS